MRMCNNLLPDPWVTTTDDAVGSAISQLYVLLAKIRGTDMCLFYITLHWKTQGKRLMKNLDIVVHMT